MVRIGVWLLILGIGSFILPLMGYQFKILQIFGDNVPYIGAGMAVIGLVLLIAGKRQGGNSSE